MDGNKTTSPAGSTCDSVVSRESARIALARTAINRLDTFTADVRNACLQTLLSQKYFITSVREFGPENVRERELHHGGNSAAVKMLVETSVNT